MNSPGQIWGDVSFFFLLQLPHEWLQQGKDFHKGQRKDLISKKLERASNFCLFGFYTAGIKVSHFPCRLAQMPFVQCLIKAK